MGFSNYKSDNEFTYEYKSLKEKRYEEIYAHALNLTNLEDVLGFSNRKSELKIYAELISGYNNVFLSKGIEILAIVRDYPLNVHWNPENVKDFLDNLTHKTIYIYDIFKSLDGIEIIRAYIE